MKAIKLTSVAVAVSMALVGCGAIEQRNEIYKDHDSGVQEVSVKKQQMLQDDAFASSAVREINGVWLGARTVKVSRDAELPSVFSKTISFQFPDNPSLTVIGDRIGKITSIPVRVTYDALVPLADIAAMNNAAVKPAAAANGMPNGMPQPVAGGLLGESVPNIEALTSGKAFILDLSSPYSGTLKDLLDQVSARYGVGWDYKDGTIIISRLVTRTYQIASLIDTNDVQTSVAKSSGTSTDGAGGTGESAGQVSQTSSNSTVSSSIQSKVDVLEGIKKAIEATLTPTVGKYSISSFGVVTVTDTREVQSQVEELINSENRAIARQVRVRFVMVEVEAAVKNDTGFDIAGAIAKASQKWDIEFSSPAGMLGGGSGAGQIGILRDGSGATTQAFIRAMSDVGRVSLRRDESYTMMNNRPLSIAQVDNFIYPARSTPGFASGDSAGAGTAGVEPGQLTTGNFLNLRASILPNGSVIINFNLDTSRKGKVETFESNGTVLQYPQSNGGNYQTYASIPNGQTGVIAAIDTSSMEATDRSIDSTVSPLLGGGIYNNKVKKVVLVLITPHVIEGAT